MYGEIRNCNLVGNAWVITTLGLKGKTGIIAVYRCVASDSACLDGQNDHPLSGWHIYKPPYQGEVTLLSSDNAARKVLIDDAGHQIWFDLETGTFYPNPATQVALPTDSPQPTSEQERRYLTGMDSYVRSVSFSTWFSGLLTLCVSNNKAA